MKTFTFNKTWFGSFLKIPHKHYEIQIYNNLGYSAFFDLEFKWTTKQDHAGISLRIAIFHLCFHSQIHDSRHWDYLTKQWALPLTGFEDYNN